MHMVSSTNSLIYLHTQSLVSERSSNSLRTTQPSPRRCIQRGWGSSFEMHARYSSRRYRDHQEMGKGGEGSSERTYMLGQCRCWLWKVSNCADYRRMVRKGENTWIELFLSPWIRRSKQDFQPCSNTCLSSPSISPFHQILHRGAVEGRTEYSPSTSRISVRETAC